MTERHPSAWAFLALLSVLAACSPEPAAGDAAARARELAERFLVVDGHIDVPYRLEEQFDDVSRRTAGGDFDAPRAREGGLDAAFMSIYVPARHEREGGGKALALRLIGMVEAIAAEHPETFRMAKSAGDVRAAAADGRIAFLLGMENGTPIERDLGNLEELARLGVRYVTLCHAEDNHLCDSSYSTARTWGGLSPFGREVVLRMNELGVLVDVSHVSDAAFDDVLAVTRAPVIASHSSARHFTPGFERNLDDDRLRALAKNGGVAMINFGSTFLREDSRLADDAQRAELLAAMKAEGIERFSSAGRAFERRFRRERPIPLATVEDVADHVMHAVRVAGADHVGFGSDFDGVGDTLPDGLKDVSQYPNLLRVLLERGMSEADLEKVCGGNVLRVLEEAERIAAG